MRFRPRPHALATAALAGVLVAPACSSASTRPPTAPGSGVAGTPAAVGMPSGAAPMTSGRVHLTAYTDNDGPTSTVILSGAVGDYGKAQSVNPDGSVNPEHGSQLALVLTHGSFRLDIAALDKKFVAAVATLPLNTVTCSGTASVSSPVPVVAGSGTGSYKGISGAFTLTVTLDEVDRPGGCSESSPFLAQAIVMTGSGTVSAR